ncbi:ubiquitin family protein [bacterium]|nr:ubiquitin family protein [bacterium]
MEKPMRQYNVQTLTGQKYLFKLATNATLYTLKAELEQKSGIAIARQSLIYCGQLLLDDDQTLESIGLQHDTTVHLVVVKTPKPSPQQTPQQSPQQTPQQSPKPSPTPSPKPSPQRSQQSPKPSPQRSQQSPKPSPSSISQQTTASTASTASTAHIGMQPDTPVPFYICVRHAVRYIAKVSANLSTEMLVRTQAPNAKTASSLLHLQKWHQVSMRGHHLINKLLEHMHRYQQCHQQHQHHDSQTLGANVINNQEASATAFATVQAIQACTGLIQTYCTKLTN